MKSRWILSATPFRPSARYCRRDFPLRIDEGLPPGSILQMLDPKGILQKSLDLRDPDLLPGGETRFRAILPQGGNIDFSWDPASSVPAKLTINGTLIFGALPEGSIVEMDGKLLQISAGGGRFSIAPGVHTLAVRRAGFIPIISWFDCQPGEEIRPLPLFVKDPCWRRRKRFERFVSPCFMARRSQ